MMMQKIFIIESLEQIDRVAQEFLDFYKNKRVFAFYGELGSGKTTFIKALCRQLGAQETTKSPTFNIVHTYTTKLNEEIYHMDCYRINSIQELKDIGYEDYFYSDHYCFIEWADKVEQLLSDDFVRIQIQVNDFNNWRILREI